MRVVLPALVLALSACTGTQAPTPAQQEAPKADDGAPKADAGAPKADAAAADTDADASEAKAEPLPVAPADPELDDKLPDEVRMKLRKARGAFEAADSAADVHAAWVMANDLKDALTEALSDDFEKSDYTMSVDWLTPKLPGMKDTLMAEGMALVFYLDAEAWKAKAAATPEPTDDAFFAMTEAAYSSADPSGWPNWGTRTWDYGGCSNLGDGTLLKVLKTTDGAKDGPWKAEVAKVRADALKEITEGNEMFPRCDPMSMEPSDDAVLKAEVQKILAEVDLTDAEKKAVEAALPGIKGEAHKGG